MSASSKSAARTSCTFKQVSSTSDEVMPWWTKRELSPMNSAKWVRKAMTSCLVTRSMASILSVSNLALEPFSQISRAASFGIMPISAIADAAWASISNQMRKRVSGDQIATISGRE